MHFSSSFDSSRGGSNGVPLSNENREENNGGGKKSKQISRLSACIVAVFGGIVGVVLYDYAFTRGSNGEEEDLWDYEWDKAWRNSSDDDVGISKSDEEQQCIGNEGGDKKVKNKRATRQILLIRHGQYVMEKDNENYKGLTELGKKQAKLTALRLKEILKNKKVIRIYHSNMKRAKETAEIISSEFPEIQLVEDSDLAEGIPQAPIPVSSNCKPSKETLAKDRPRIDKAFEKLFYRPVPSKNLLGAETVEIVVCHGNVIRYMFCRALQFPTCGWLRLATYNCGITWMSVDSGGYVSTREFGNVGHLPVDMITYY